MVSLQNYRFKPRVRTKDSVEYSTHTTTLVSFPNTTGPAATNGDFPISRMRMIHRVNAQILYFVRNIGLATAKLIDTAPF